jgi:2-methylcitrate dehydratase PrpD
MNATEAFARHVLETPFGAVPPEAVAAAKTFILDSIGVGIAGAKAPYAKEALAAARGWGGPGVAGAAQVWGRGARLPGPSAAFVNGFQIHCQEFDCVHEPAVVHPMATILAALMAEIESRPGACGAELIAAAALAVDVAAGLGVAATSGIRFFRPANAGLFGATLGVARLRGFDLEQALDALGYALAHASGTMQAHVEGTPGLPVQIGNAARAALMACDLAAVGLPGPHDVFEGPFGYFALFEKTHDLGPVIESLGKTWRIAEVSHKPFPTGRAAHGGIVLMRMLRESGVEASAVRRITLMAPPLIRRLVGRPYRDGMPVSYARLCFPYCGALALLYGTVGLDDFSEARRSDEKIAELARRMAVEEDGSENPAAFIPQRAIAELADGRKVTVETDRLPGSPAAPLSREDQLAKLNACLGYGLGAGRGAVAELLRMRIAGLETDDDAAGLARLAAGL